MDFFRSIKEKATRKAQSDEDFKNKNKSDTDSDAAEKVNHELPDCSENIDTAENDTEFDYSGLSEQEAVDFLSNYNKKPVKTIDDVETCIKVCESAKDKSSTILYNGYWYDSMFIVYENLFNASQREELGKSKETFEKTVAVGLESLQKLDDSDNILTMGLRTEILLRHPDQFGYPSSFTDIERAEEIKRKRIEGYYDSTSCFRSFIAVDDLKEASFYCSEGSREQMYCKLYQHDEEALDYFKSLWESSEQRGRNVDISVGVSYLFALKMHLPDEADAFRFELEEICKSRGNAESFTHWARMDLKVFSNDNGFSLISWVDAGTDEPTLEDAENSLRHCEMGLEKIRNMQETGPYEYRNRVFLNETKGWVYAHLMPKTCENYQASLQAYRDAIRLYVEVEDFEHDLQYATSRHCGMLKEVMSLFTVPKTFGFDDECSEDPCMHELFESYRVMGKGMNSGFPFLNEYHAAFENLSSIMSMKKLKDKTLDAKKIEVVELVAQSAAASYSPAQQRKVELEIAELQQTAVELEEILEDPELNAYYEGFMFTFSSVYIVSVAITQGSFSIEKEYESAVSFASSLISLIPVVGASLATGVEYIASTIEDEMVSARAKNIVKLAPTISGLEKMTQDLCIKLINVKKNTIKELEKLMEENGEERLPWGKRVLGLVDKAKEKIQGLKNKMFDGNEIFNCVESELGNRDATIIIDSFVAKGEIAKIKKATPSIRVMKLNEFVSRNSEKFEFDSECTEMFSE